MTARTLTIGGGTYPLVLPNIRDPRLHVAAVVLTVHALGQLGLHFWVSVPQIIAAIGTCFILEVAITFYQTKTFVWPASAMLTGSAVALIMRVVGTQPDDHWTNYAWYVFAAVAGLALLSKYVIRHRGSHIFNPANLGLVVAFLVLGPARVEPLDFWWAPLNLPMLAAYAVIGVGGLLITRRLRLLGLAAAFWITLAIGIGILAASGHSIVARWSFAPVTGFDFWRVIVTSPEVLIFLFFMITDPKTVPAGRIGRVVFGALVALVSTLLMAPQQDEWWTKVGLLTGLVLVCAARPIVDRLVPAPGSEGDTLAAFGRRILAGPARLGIAAVAVLAMGGGIVVAGGQSRALPVANAEEVLAGVPHTIDPSTLPPIAVGQDVVDFDPELAGAGMQSVLITLAQNLEVENQALIRRDAALLDAVDHGNRRAELQAEVAAAKADGTYSLRHYRFDAIAVRLLRPFGRQDGFSIGFDAAGTVVIERYGADGELLSTETQPFQQTFAVRRVFGARWLTVDVLAYGAEAPAVPLELASPELASPELASP